MIKANNVSSCRSDALALVLMAEGFFELLWSVFSPSLLLTLVRGQNHFLCRQRRGEEKGRKQMSVSILWSVISPSLLLTLVRRENARSPALSAD